MAKHELLIPQFVPTSVNKLMSSVKARIRCKRGDRDLVAFYAASQQIPQAVRRRRVSVKVTCKGKGRLPDPDNLLKSLLDGLKAARLIVDDAAEWCVLGEVSVVRGDRRQTVVALEDC